MAFSIVTVIQPSLPSNSRSFTIQNQKLNNKKKPCPCQQAVAPSPWRPPTRFLSVRAPVWARRIGGVARRVALCARRLSRASCVGVRPHRGESRRLPAFRGCHCPARPPLSMTGARAVSTVRQFWRRRLCAHPSLLFRTRGDSASNPRNLSSQPLRRPRSHEQRATPAAARPGRRPAAPASDPSQRVRRAISPRLCFCLPDGWLRRASSRELVVLLCILFGETSGQTLLLSLNWNDYEVLIYSRQVSPVRHLTCECPLRFCGSSFSFAQWCSLNHERFFALMMHNLSVLCTFSCIFFGGQVLSFLLAMYLELEFLGPGASAC